MDTFKGIELAQGIHIVNLENFDVMFKRILDENTDASPNPFPLKCAMLKCSMQMTGHETPNVTYKGFKDDQNYLITGGLKKPVLFLNLKLLTTFLDKVDKVFIDHAASILVEIRNET